MTPQFQLVKTADGSVSCVESETGQLCHNSAGAYTEALTNYVRPSGLLDTLRRQGHIRVLDACYGLGYNSWALINEMASQLPSFRNAGSSSGSGFPKTYTVTVVAIERFPEVLGFLPHVLDYPTFDALKNKIPPSEHNAYYRTLECFCNTKGVLDEVRFLSMDLAGGLRIELELWVSDLRQRVIKLKPGFDAIFHDPFSPQKMPELWSVDLFREYYRLLEPTSGLLLTYSAAAAVRGGLLEAGFTVAKTQPLGAKSGGTLARLSSAPDREQPDCLPLSDWELEYLESRAGIPYRDAMLCNGRSEILARREWEQVESLRPAGASALKKRPRRIPNF